MATTIAEVKEIISTSAADSVITGLITAAGSYMSSVLSSGDLTTAQTDEIKRWMVAHMLAMSIERQGAAEEVGDAQIKYTGKYDMRLQATTYGQMVMTLDTSGKLQQGGKKKASTRSVTKEDE